MPIKHKLGHVALADKKQLRTLVENRMAFTLDQCELNIFETHQQSQAVPLTFNDFVVTSMLRGKKVMHLFDKPGFDYLPGETVIVPPNIGMKIDFPEAAKGNPTQCIALAIDHSHIDQTVHFLNEKYPQTNEQSAWKLNYSQYHFCNDQEIALLINKLIKICTDTSAGKDILADLALKELLVRIMQTQNLASTIEQTALNGNPLAYVIAYIKANIHEKIQVEELSNKAYMSQATFYRTFKREFGTSPLEFIYGQKINLAKQMLKNPMAKVSSISYELGFSDLNYFIRVFKKHEGITPKIFQQKLQSDQTIN